MMFPKRLLSVLAAGVLAQCLLATEPFFPDLPHMVLTSWTERDGLPSNMVLDALQDGNGYVWIASPDGLIRFDGINFTIWSKSNSDDFSSLSARVLALAPNGTLWIGTNSDGLYAWSHGGFDRFDLDSGLPDLSIGAIASDSQGRLWIGTGRGVCLFDGSRFRLVLTPQEFGAAAFFMPLADGSLLAASGSQGLWSVSDAGVEPAFPKMEKRDRNSLAQTTFSAGWQDKSGRIWLGTDEGRILRISGNGVKEIVAPAWLRGGSIRSFFADAQGTVWVGTDHGLIFYRDDRFDAFAEADGLPDNRVSRLFQDREGNVWVGSDGGGISKYTKGKFHNYTKHDGLASSVVNTVCTDQYGSLWVGTDEGLSFLKSPRDPYANDARRRYAVDALVSTFAKVRIRQLRFGQGQTLWISSYFLKGLARFDGRNVSFLNQKDGLPTNRVHLTFEDHLGRLWIATTAGLLLKTDKIRVFGEKDGLPIATIQDIFEDSSGSIWLATDGKGVARLDGETFSVFDAKNGLASPVVFRIFEDQSKRLWVACADGISLWQDGSFHPLTARMGLAADAVWQILPGDQDQVWLMTSRGVIVAEAKELADLALGKRHDIPHQRILDTFDGLAGALSNGSWASRDKQGLVYLPGRQGLSVYDPKENGADSPALPVVVESLEVDGQHVVPTGDKFQLRAGAHRVTLNYTALGFVAPQKLRFRYQLQGYDPQWITAGSQRSISYTNLTPGSYQFKVQVWNQDGKLEEPGAVLTLDQAALFWQSVWSYLLVAMALVGLGFALNTLRLRQVMLHRRDLETLVNARTRELAHERNRSDGLLLDILPPRAIQELEETGRVAPSLQRDVTVLVADLVDFSRISAVLTPDQTLGELNSIFAAFDEIILQEGCERVKTTGDAYMAMAGAGVPIGQGAMALCTVAVAMLQYLQRRHQPGLPPWKLRVGLASGSALAGVVGVKKFAWDMFGEAVSLAWQMQQHSVPQGITLAPSTKALVEGKFNLLARPPLAIRGKGELQTWFIVYKDAKKLRFQGEGSQALAEIKRLEEAKDFGAALTLLRQLDYTVMEAETAFAIWKLGGKCAYLSGKMELAINAWQNALQYGIADRATEQNLAVLRKR